MDDSNVVENPDEVETDDPMTPEQWDQVANSAYDAYCASVGDVAWDNQPLPEYGAEGRERQWKGWRVAVKAAVEKALEITGLDDDEIEKIANTSVDETQAD